MPYIRIKARRWHKNKWCRLFGHIRDGYHGDIPYGSLETRGIDGLNHEHVAVTTRCERCSELIDVIRFHRIPSEK